MTWARFVLDIFALLGLCALPSVLFFLVVGLDPPEKGRDDR
jgi:hypothetical protein